MTAGPAPRDHKLGRAAPAAVKLEADARGLRARQEAVLRTMRRLKSRRRLPAGG